MPAQADLLTAELTAIREEIAFGSRLRVAERDAPRLLAAVEAVLKRISEAKAVASIPPADCTNNCFSGPCDCSGEFRAVGWNLDPEALRKDMAKALLGDAPDGKGGTGG